MNSDEKYLMDHQSFKWIINEFSSLPTNTVLLSSGIHPLGSSWCRLKFVKYETGFGLFHVNKQNLKKTNVTTPFTFNVVEKDPSIEEENEIEKRKLSIKTNNDFQMQYLITASDINEKELVKWSVCFTSTSISEDNIIGKFFNTQNDFPLDSLVLDCCLKVTLAPTTEELSFSGKPNLSCKGWENLSKDLKALYKTSLNSDVILSVGSHQIRAHKSILSARSPVFKKIFDHNMEESKQNFVDITDVPKDAFEKLIEYMYTGVFTETCISFNELCELYCAAGKYDVIELQNKCGNTLLSIAMPSTMMEILQLADTHSDLNLKSETLNLIRFSFESVVNTEAWDFCRTNKPHLITEVHNFCAKRLKRN
ncbi:speckle-type POZ protein B [Caerostris extrusa]|uniref:Speckle-type POZ protein B n=1 Tax=Caerostris extrusa TaxID=172846 RepID=A0AAV4Q0M0_CAEEX|nr:speckle-type POZ protein B [Caerostris extrusa]